MIEPIALEFDPGHRPGGASSVEGVPGAACIEGVLSQAEAEQLLQLAESMGYKEKRSSRSGPPIRTNQRLLLEAPPELVDPIAQRLRPYLESLDLSVVGEDWTLAPGSTFLNPKWRFNRYRPGEQFFPHFDSGHEFSAQCRTLLSLVIYLNDDFVGGETTFFPDHQSRDHMFPGETDRAEVRIKPATGAAVVFHHYGPWNPRHSGKAIESGRPKHIIRADIVFERPRRSLLFGRRPVPVVVLAGRQGCGKSTQAERLAAALGWEPLNFGSLVRSLPPDSELGRKLALHRAERTSLQDRHYGKSEEGRRPGGWLPDEFCQELIAGHLGADHGARGYVLDGFPRMRSQTLALESSRWALLKVFELQLEEQERVSRLQNRAREGDEQVSRAAREEDWRRDTLPMLEHYDKRGELERVDASPAPEQVTRALVAGVDRRLLADAELDLPAELKAELDGFETCGRSLATSRKRLVYRYQRGTEVRYLKLGRVGGLSREKAAYDAAWTASFPFRTPTVVGFASWEDRVGALLTLSLPGQTAKYLVKNQELTTHQIQKLAESVAASLKLVHGFTAETDLTDRSAAVLLEKAGARWNRGEVSFQSFASKYSGRPGAPTREELSERLDSLRELGANLPGENVFLHGDPCLPNLAVDPDSLEVLGFLDWEMWGRGDPHWDLALAAWSFRYNLGEEAERTFLGAYGAVDPARLEFYGKLIPYLL